MKRITAILILTFVSLFNTSYSQSKTPYEKKVDQIMTEMCKAIGVDNSLIQMAVKLNDWDIVRTSQDLAFKSKMLDKNELLVIIFATDKKLKDAEQLKNDVDYRKEKERQEKENLLKAQELQKGLMRFSDLENIKTDIKTEFSKWVKKDEFETNSDYKIRTNNKEKIIDSIAYEFVIKRISELDCSYNAKRFLIELKNYDSDSQKYPITIVHKAYIGSTYQEKKETFNDTLIVNINLAKRIKEISKSGNLYWDGSEGDIIFFCDESISFSQKLNNWAVSTNGYFFPISYTFFKDYTHTCKTFETPITKLTIETNDLGLQEYFSENYSINIGQLIIKKLELKRNDLIKQAEKLEFENNLEQAITILNEAYQIQNTEDIKTKISKIEIKIVERKYNNLIQSAEQYLSSGQLSNSIEKLEKAKDLFLEANMLKYSENVDSKIVAIENKITEIKQNELMKSAEQFEKSGKISSSIEKLQEANKLKIRADIISKIEVLTKSRDMALTNHKTLDSLLIVAQSEKTILFNEGINIASLDEIKSGYGQKYLECKSLIKTKINSLWTVVSNTNTEYYKIRNKEVWNDKSQELLIKVNEFINELKMNSNFEKNIQKAITEKDKKYLKILKDDDLNAIIETVIKTI